MPQTCPKCHRANPADALYCYQDGFSLGGRNGHAGPVDPGAQPFPMPFVFPNGTICRNFDQLALACHNAWPTAIELLRHGDLANFLAGLGRVDLAKAAREALRDADKDRALDQLLGQLPANTIEPAKLHVRNASDQPRSAHRRQGPSLGAAPGQSGHAHAVGDRRRGRLHLAGPRRRRRLAAQGLPVPEQHEHPRPGPRQAAPRRRQADPGPSRSRNQRRRGHGPGHGRGPGQAVRRRRARRGGHAATGRREGQEGPQGSRPAL